MSIKDIPIWVWIALVAIVVVGAIILGIYLYKRKGKENFMSVDKSSLGRGYVETYINAIRHVNSRSKD